MKREIYKGCEIRKSVNENFGSSYFTIVNLKNSTHCHAKDIGTAKNIINCFWSIYNYNNGGNYNLSIRNRALKLANINIRQ